MPSAVEELLRYESPSQHTARIAPAGAVLGGKEIPEGDAVIAVMGAGQPRPRAVPRPRPARPRPRGQPPPGLRLGQPTSASAPRWPASKGRSRSRRCSTRFPELSLAPDETIEWRPNLGLRGLTELHVVAS